MVADEVRKLSKQSAEASKNTAVLIENSVSTVEKGMGIAEQTSRSLNVVRDTMDQVVDTVNRITWHRKNRQSQWRMYPAELIRLPQWYRPICYAEESAAAARRCPVRRHIWSSLWSGSTCTATEKRNGKPIDLIKWTLDGEIPSRVCFLA